MTSPDDPRRTQQWLTEYLNDGPTLGQKLGLGWDESLPRFVRDINEVDEIASQNGYPDGGRMQLIDYPNGKHASRVLERIDSVMSRAALSPRLLIPASDGWRPQWRSGTPQSVEQSVFNVAVASVFDLAVAGELSKIRECPHCRKWFVAAKKGKSQRFCSENCRSSAWRTTSSGRESRREYMREYMRRRRYRAQRHTKFERKQLAGKGK
jgi:hypothetical protein